ncbi:TRAP transporter large permease subunit [Hahella sp. KA22]|uniref:TRAP transporter large permease n=1 Tax=Hahella sp. KA22 TaxID=1628392 RepID=UPI000FDE7A43|nr:TRAP transporter large permease [Hahella sp. KA22]AZZ90590.1 TRAP transporter large permease [Hahella sp. KA22]QAY53960.1 TRAP transporter large permease subunit [Hahella sp. KA22]
MDDLYIGVIAFASLLVLIFLRIPVAAAMLLTGAAGYTAILGWDALMNHFNSGPFYRFSSYDLAVIPMFLLMAQFATVANLNKTLFSACNSWFGSVRGGLAMASITSCAFFGAISGSSLATTLTMSKVALPEMQRHGYSNQLSAGVLAAGGTLGILIPPSIALVIYALLTEQNISKLFIAAAVPGIIATIGYLLAVQVYVRLFPSVGPQTHKASAVERLSALLRVTPVLAIFLGLLGGIYGGVFTVTEGAAIGAFATWLLAQLKRQLDRQALMKIFRETAVTTGLVFFIILGADLFNSVIVLSNIPNAFADAITSMHLSATAVIIILLLIYLALGCFLDSMSMLLLTVPIFFPVVMSLNFNMPPEHTAIWFGVLAVVAIEIGLITPPVGMNIFVLKSQAEHINLLECYKGVTPFIIADILRLAILVAWPGIVLIFL